VNDAPAAGGPALGRDALDETAVLL